MKGRGNAEHANRPEDLTRAEKRLRVTTERTQGSSFSLEEMLDAPEVSSRSQDELARYIADTFISLDTEDLMHKDEMGMVRFWEANSRNYPMLKKVAFRVYATPASSCSSERDFSCVNRIITADRTR